MEHTFPKPAFAPGCRCSTTDGIVLFIGAAATIITATFDSTIAFAIAFPIIHFFIFCNVIRMARPLELIWAALYLALASTTTLTGHPGWFVTGGVLALLTVVLIAVEMRKPSYHGVFWQRINPQLPDWWGVAHPMTKKRGQSVTPPRSASKTLRRGEATS
jgi:hypothetical protein